jgi:hypothetical protein
LFIFSYASTLDFGHYSRLEQIQKRLWYFSYLKYPISSIYYYLTNSTDSILSSEQPSILYSRPCPGCLRCQPSLMEKYHLSKQEPKKTSFFSRLYQSNRSNIKPAVVPQLAPPEENPECGTEYCIDTDKQPIQLWAKTVGKENEFEIDISEKLERFNYDKSKYPKQTISVQHIRFHPNMNLLNKHILINHDKFNVDRQEEDLIECEIELSEKAFKFIQINHDLLSSKKPTVNELEENSLEEKGIFLFPRRRHQRVL